MQIRVLGRVTVLVGQSSLQVRRAQTRGILALLALNIGRVVSLDSIAEAIWGEGRPGRARARIHTCVSEIRRCFDSLGVAELMVSDRYGYLLDAPQDCLDANRREHELRRARSLLGANEHAAAERHLRAALAMGRGGPLADAAGVFVEPARLALEEQRLGALEDLATVRIEMRRYDEVVSDLLPLVEQHPFRERLRGRLMVALHCSGRQAQALRTFREYRSQLAELDGLDPGRDISDLADAILQDDYEFAPEAKLLPEAEGTDRLKPALGPGHAENTATDPPHGLPHYRLLTGPDDDRFCCQVSEALRLGYRLHGGVSVTHDGEKVIAAQAVVWPSSTVD